MLNCCGMMQLPLFSCEYSGVLLDSLCWVNLPSFGSRWSQATKGQMLMDSSIGFSFCCPSSLPVYSYIIRWNNETAYMRSVDTSVDVVFAELP